VSFVVESVFAHVVGLRSAAIVLFMFKIQEWTHINTTSLTFEQLSQKYFYPRDAVLARYYGCRPVFVYVDVSLTRHS